MSSGVDPTDLSAPALLRELDNLHATRNDTFRYGADDALVTHTDRTVALEREYLRRWPAREVEPDRTRDGARDRTEGPGTHQERAPVDAPADRVFAFLADVANLPRYFPAITRAQARGGEHVHVEAEVDGRSVSGQAWLQVDEEHRRMRWGAEGPNDYYGELAVTERDPDTCDIEVWVHTTRAGGPAVADGLRDTVQLMAEQATADAA